MQMPGTYTKAVLQCFRKKENLSQVLGTTTPVSVKCKIMKYMLNNSKLETSKAVDANCIIFIFSSPTC